MAPSFCVGTWILVLGSDHLVMLSRARDALFTKVQGSGAESLPSLGAELVLGRQEP